MVAESISFSALAEAPRARVSRVLVGDAPLTWRGFAELLCGEDPALRRGLTAEIAGRPEAGLCWETPGIAAGNLDQPFMMAIIPSPSLDRATPNPRPFAAHIEPDEGPRQVRTFANLGGDSILLAPRKAGPASAYHHLAAFLRHAPPAQVDALWRAVGSALTQWWSTRTAPVWLSTAGGGVAWLHVRLDRRPKYYKYSPFCPATDE